MVIHIHDYFTLSTFNLLHGLALVMPEISVLSTFTTPITAPLSILGGEMEQLAYICAFVCLPERIHSTSSFISFTIYHAPSFAGCIVNCWVCQLNCRWVCICVKDTLEITYHNPLVSEAICEVCERLYHVQQIM